DPSIPHSPQESAASSSCGSPDKTFHCSECGKGFKKKGHLLQHGVIHSGARPYACSTCSRMMSPALSTVPFLLSLLQLQIV
uniref:C2H2-type domain-containing protein n=1 Tax=Cyprinus carpio TaxID=7962 RepID=A0A8C2HMX2_CYPCA